MDETAKTESIEPAEIRDESTSTEESVGKPAKLQVDGVLSNFGGLSSGRSQFCRLCGTRLFLYCKISVADMRDQVVVPVGAIDGSHEDERLRGIGEGWCKGRESWMPEVRDTKIFEEC